MSAKHDSLPASTVGPTTQAKQPQVVRSCNHEGCNETAMWRLIIEARTAYTGTAVLLYLPVAVCGLHRDEGSVIGALSAAGVCIVEDTLAGRGLEIPDIDWERSRVRYVSL